MVPHQVFTGSLTAVCIAAQASISAEDHHDLNAAFAYGYVACAILHLSTALRMQLTLNVVPSQNPRMSAGGTNEVAAQPYLPTRPLPLRRFSRWHGTGGVLHSIRIRGPPDAVAAEARLGYLHGLQALLPCTCTCKPSRERITLT